MRFGEKGVVEALYISGVALTTVGFGDVVATSDVLRLLTVLEAASGLLAITASVTYVLSVNPLLTELRTAARIQADLGTPELERATRLVALGASSEIAELHRHLSVAQQHVDRFPVLFYFRPSDEREGLTTLLRAGAVMYLVLVLGVRRRANPISELYGDALGSALERAVRDFERRYVRQKHEAPDVDVEQQAAQVRAAVAASGLPARTDVLSPDEAAFARRLDRCLHGLAREQCYPPRPLVGVGDVASRPQARDVSWPPQHASRVASEQDDGALGGHRG